MRREGEVHALGGQGVRGLLHQSITSAPLIRAERAARPCADKGQVDRESSGILEGFAWCVNGNSSSSASFRREGRLIEEAQWLRALSGKRRFRFGSQS